MLSATGFHMMAKPGGAICNLACDYCYYLSKEMLYPGSRCRMSSELLETFVRQYIEAQGGGEVTFAWQGGEPTRLGVGFYRQVVALQRRHAPPGTRIVNALQTNGTLLDDAWCAFFREHDFLVGISIDGPRHLHDAYRLDRRGRGSFERVMTGLRLLQQHGVEVNVLTSVHAANAGHPLEVYRFLRDDAGARYVQFIPIVERADPDGPTGAVASARSVRGEQYGEFLVQVFDEWVRRDVGETFVQLFDVTLSTWLGLGAGLCVFEATCGGALALEHNGDVYACDHFVEPDHLIGNLAAVPLLDLVGSPKQRSFGRAKRDGLPSECRTCDVGFACHGGCPKDRLLRTEAGEPGLSYLCAGYRRFFRHVDPAMRYMANELRRGRPPAGIMRAIARRSAGPGAPPGS
jgi:uncharacterized protein